MPSLHVCFLCIATLFLGSRVAVFTWKGACLELSGKTEGAPYVAEHTPMV